MMAELSILNPHPREIPGPDLLHHLVLNGGKNDFTAIEYLSPLDTIEQLTYRELHENADTLARKLVSNLHSRRDAIGKRLIIPVFLPQCPDLYISELAILKAGAAFCPISLDVPAQRLRFILEDVNAKILLTTTELRDRLPELRNISIVTVDDLGPDVDGAQVPNNVVASDAAYIMYTSGSTGQPKGVVLSHKAATQALLAHDEHIPSFSRFLQFASPTFDVSVFEIFFPLFRGCTLVCGERRQMLNDLPGFINRMSIDAAELTPSVANSLLRGRHSVPSLKLLLTIGEMLKREVIEEFGGSPEQESILYGMYGPTEATIHCTLQTLFYQGMSVGNIGVPFSTVSVFVVQPLSPEGFSNEYVDVIPVGEEGELAIGGYQIADGYLNREEQTRVAFIDHPEYGRIYRTGDRARITPSGKVECLGRLSNGQVKLRGQRVELGEVEYAASRANGCEVAVADVISGALVVFCVCSADCTEGDVREACRRWLPTFMIPADVVFLDNLPYLSSGKLDRKELQDQYIDSKSNLDTHHKLNTRQLAIVEVFADVLQSSIELSTPLAAAGLDSLSAIRISSRLKRIGFAQPDATLLLESRTVQDIERQLTWLGSEDDALYPEDYAESGRRDAYNTAVHSVLSIDQRSDIEDVYPSTHVQSAMLSETERDHHAYCNWIELVVPSQYLDILSVCIERLATHHALLRSGFVAVQGLETSHATIVWKSMPRRQIQQVRTFDFGFRITNKQDLLRPCTFQLLQNADEIRILLKIHHALYDQWSIDLLRLDLGNLLRGQELSPRPSFEAVSLHNDARRSLVESERATEFWQRHLQSFNPTRVPSMTGSKLPHKVRRTAWHEQTLNFAAMRAEARLLGLSAPTLFQAAISYLLGCYAGSTDVTFGVVFSGRHLPIPDIETMFGPCLATLPFRIDPSESRTNLDFLHTVQDRNRGLQQYTLTPLADIKRMASSGPGDRLFDTLFVWQESSLETENLVREIDSADYHEFNLALEFQPTYDGRLRTRATYQQALLPTRQVELLFEQATALAEHMLHSPDELVESVFSFLAYPLLSLANPSPSPCATESSLLSTINDTALRFPDSKALTFAESIDNEAAEVRTLTYRELNVMSNRMANVLVSRQVRPDELICICMEKSIELYVSILATIKAGAGYLPLVPKTPIERIRSILKQSGVRICLCDSHSVESFSSFDKVQVVDVIHIDLLRYSAEPPMPNVLSSHVAYTVFTSGSTGEPKGVAITFENLLGNLQALTDLYDVHPRDRMLQACSQAFDVSVFEIFFAFCTGMCLCSATKDTLFHDLEASIRSLAITHLSLTPTVAALIDPARVPGVKFLVTAGEGVTGIVHQKWAGHGLHQGYGPSETTNICTVHMNMATTDAIGNIGPPLRNTSAFVLSQNSHFDILPAGAIGELAFGGEQVFRGYVGMDALNSEKIIEHSRFGRVYKSGDMGRILHDGSLLFEGRIDDQVKIRGNRVELGEINAVVLRDQNMHDCATISIGSEASGQTLATFVVPRELPSSHSGRPQLVHLSGDAIRSIFRNFDNHLQAYMVPNVVVPIDTLPLTSQGKLDRQYLRHLLEQLDFETKQSLMRDHEYVDVAEPWTQEEMQIASVLAETQGLLPSDIKRSNSFFAMGMDSLTAIPFSKKLTTTLGFRVDVSTILRNSSIARLSRWLVEQSKSDSGCSPSVLPAPLPKPVVEAVRKSSVSFEANIESVLPCTPLQEAMLSKSPSRGKHAYYNIVRLRVTGSWSRLRRSWETMMARHSILRTRFMATDDSEHPHVQVVLKHLALPLNLPTQHSSDHQQSFEITDTNTDRNMVNENVPFRIAFDGSDQGGTLTLRMHHAIYDEISMMQLLHEVELDYLGESLPPVSSFGRFLGEARKQASKDAVSYWAAHLKDFQPIPLPSLHTHETTEERSMDLSLPISSSVLDGFCKRHGVSQLSVFQAALVKTIACCQLTRDICFGNVVSGRTVPLEGIDTLVAPCFNTIPLRVDLRHIRTNLDLIDHLSARNVGSLPYHLTPLRRIQKLSKSPSTHLFDFLLILQPPSRPLDSKIWTLEKEEVSMDLPFVFEVEPNANGFRVHLHYLLFFASSSLATKIAEAFASSFSSCIAYPYGDLDYFDGYRDDRIYGALVNRDEVENAALHDSEEVPDETWNSTEDIVRSVFASLADLPTERVHKDTSLYQIGLDSLNAAQVAHRLRTRGIDIDIADVMQKLTPRALAALARTRAPATAPSQDSGSFQMFDKQHRSTIMQALSLNDGDLQAIRPCTSVQSGMLAQSLHTEGELYVNHVTYVVPVAVSSQDLERAWSALRTKHQMLRTGFHHLGDGQTRFAMIIQCATTQVQLVEVVHSLELNEVEMRATSDIMQTLSTRPWRLTLQRREHQTFMILSMHHALYDASSLRLILEDLAIMLSSSAISFESTIDSTLQAILAAEADPNGAAERHWRSVLNKVSISKFPDLSPTLVPNGSLLSKSIKSSLSLSSIEQVSKEEGATVQSVGQTAWALLLAAYTGDTHVSFGTVFAGAPSSDVALPTITTIPVVCDTEGPVMDVVQRMSSYNASCQRHKYTPLADIQRYAGHVREPLFDTIFMYQKMPSANRIFDWPIVRETAAVDYTASLELEADSEGLLRLRLTFEPSKIPTEHADLILHQYEHILTQLAPRSGGLPGNAPSIWSILPAKEATLASEVTLLHEFVEQSARLYPARTALEFVSGVEEDDVTLGHWTYKELNDRGNQVAHIIQQAGIQPNSIIAVCMKKCPEASFAFLGILKVGCAFLAIDPDLPESRLVFILQDSNARFLFVDDRETPKAVMDTVQHVRLKEGLLSTLPSFPPVRSHVSADATCYCLYTSGTTGTPKGCEITHENAVQAMLAFQRLFAGRWTKSSKWLQFASYWFDVSILEQYWSWSVGITVVGAPRDLVLGDLPSFLQRLNITHIDLTPSLARLLHPRHAQSLIGGVFITGGEALKQEIIDAWGPERTICNGYGPTEATIGVTMNTFIGDDAKPSNIGRQFDNVGTYVLRPQSEEPVLRGGIGELCVSGKLVGKGYLNRVDLTATSFPFLSRYGEKVYRTGDLVRMLADGSFVFIGRQDSQAKLRGQRLEIAEIDSVIRHSTQNLSDIVSLVIQLEEGTKEALVSFISNNARPGQDDIRVASSEALRNVVRSAREACVNTLPSYMVPSHILPVNYIPLTVNNKVDTKRLVSLFKAATPRELQKLINSEDDARTLSHPEQRIVAVLCELLKINPEEITKQSNLFSLGLSSISAISFSSRLIRTGFQSASIRAVMQNPTLVQLSNALSQDSKEHEDKVLDEQTRLWITAFARRYTHIACRTLFVPVDLVEAILPCSPLQQGLIIESMRSESRPHFNIFQYEMHDADVLRMKLAIQRWADHIQVLRLRIISTDDSYLQVFLRQATVSISEWHASEDSILDMLAEKKEEWLQRNEYDLVSPFEVHIVHSNNTHHLVFHIHHALYDGISYDLMIERLAYLYVSDAETDFGPPFTAGLLHGPLRTAVKDAKAFWTSHLEAFQYNSILATETTDIMEDPVLTLRIELSKGFESARKQLEVSHQAMIQACFEIALHMNAPSAQTYGVVVSGRSIDLEGADQVLGPMFNTLPQPLSVDLKSTLVAHIQGRHKLNVELLPFQHTPLRDIRKWCGQTAFDPLFDVLFVFQHARALDRFDSSILKPVNSAPRAVYPIAFEVEMSDDDHMAITLVAQKQFHSQQDVRSFLDTFNTVLRHAIETCDIPVSDLMGTQPSSRIRTSTKPGKAPVQVNGVSHFEWSEEATAVREIIAQLCGIAVEDIDEHTSLFAIGMDSIDAVKLSSRLKRAGLYVPVSKILQAQTIPRILHATEKMNQRSVHSAHTSRLQDLGSQLESLVGKALRNQISIERILPATPNQEALVADMVRSGFSDYFGHDILRLHSDVEWDRLRAAWQTVLDASPIFRTSFIEISDAEVDGAFAQVIHRPDSVTFRKYQVKNFDEILDLTQRIRKDVMVDMQTTPPLRLTLVSVQSDRYLILSLAHALYDGHSIALLHEDVRQAYFNDFKPRPPPDSAIEAALLASEADSRRYWLDSLSGAHVYRFPSMTSKATNEKTYRIERYCSLASQAVREFCRQHHISMQTLGQTCWAVTLAHYTRNLEVVFGVVLACRDSEEMEQIMFPTMNTVVLRSTLHGSKAQMLQYMQSLGSDMLLYQRTPLRRIQAWCADHVHIDNSVHRSGLFDTLFIYQQRPKASVSAEAALYTSIESHSEVEYPLAVEMEAADDDLCLRAACKGDVFDDIGLADLLGTMEKVLLAVITTPDDLIVQFEGDHISLCGLDPFFARDQEVNTSVINAIDLGDSDEAATTPLVQRILEIFAEVSKLPVDQINPSSTIESIGVDSISSIKVAALLRKDGIDLNVSEILRARTPKKMAEQIDQRKAEEDSPAVSPLDIVSNISYRHEFGRILAEKGVNIQEVETVMPASAGQVYMLSMWQKTYGRKFYSTFEYKTGEGVTSVNVSIAWTDLVGRHPILRTVFYATRDPQYPLLQVVLSHPQLGRLSKQTFASIQIDESNHLRLTIHHALYDAISLQLLLQDFNRLLNREASDIPQIGQESVLVTSLTSRTSQKEFWQHYLRDVKQPRTLKQPTDVPLRAVKIFIPHLIPDISPLERLARRQDLSIQALVFASYAKVYASLVDIRHDGEIVLGIYLSNRSHMANLDEATFPTLSIVPLVVRRPLQCDVSALAKDIQADLREIGTAVNSSSALWEIYDWTGIKVDTFINFLIHSEEVSHGSITASESSLHRRDRERREVTEANETGFEVPPELQMEISPAYQHSLDIEIAIRDGGLAAGLFCPEEMLGVDAAGQVLEELGRVLDQTIEAASA